MTDYHAPANGDLFAPMAACGTTADAEPDGILRLYQPGLEVTCARCREFLLDPTEAHE